MQLMFSEEKPGNSGVRKRQDELSKDIGQVERLERFNLCLIEHQHGKDLCWTYTRYMMFSGRLWRRRRKFIASAISHLAPPGDSHKKAKKKQAGRLCGKTSEQLFSCVKLSPHIEQSSQRPLDPVLDLCPSRHQIHETERFCAGKGKVTQFLMWVCVVMRS